MACQSAWAAAQTNKTYLSAQFRPLAISAASSAPSWQWLTCPLVISYHSQTSIRVCGPGADYFDRLHAAEVKRTDLVILHSGLIIRCG